MSRIPLHKPQFSPKAREHIEQALDSGQLGGGGVFTEKCERWLETHTGTPRALLTTSCTSALEMCALLLDIKPGDEIIMPSWTFPSTASAFVLRGGVPVFVDIRADTLNIDESLIAEAITERTRAIAAVHYAGVGCEMANILKMARKHGLYVVEDAAQGLLAYYRNRHLGTLGDLGTLSFQSTKNMSCGEGGALLINDPALRERAELLRDKGTNRLAWQRGEVPSYQWMEASSFGPPPEITAALLAAQLDEAKPVTDERRQNWLRYSRLLKKADDGLQQPAVPETCRHNGHIYYVLLRSREEATKIHKWLGNSGIETAPHYRPLHQAPAGQRLGNCPRPLPMTEAASERVLRLPLWPAMPGAVIEQVVQHLRNALET